MDTSQENTESDLIPIGGNNLDIDLTRKCKHCEQGYNPRKSRSSLKLTYCTTLCESLNLGFHLASLESGNYEFRAQEKVIKKESKFSKLLPKQDKVIEGPESEELVVV